MYFHSWSLNGAKGISMETYCNTYPKESQRDQDQALEQNPLERKRCPPSPGVVKLLKTLQ